MERFTGLIGFVAIMLIAYAMSTNRKAIRWRPVAWGLILQIIVAIFVLKGKAIAAALAGVAPPLEQWGAALIFIAVAVIVTQIAKRLPPGGARRGLWIAFGLVSLFLFLAYNLLAYLFETMKHVVTG